MIGFNVAGLGFFAILFGIYLAVRLTRAGRPVEWQSQLAAALEAAQKGRVIEGERDGLRFQIRLAGAVGPRWLVFFPDVQGPDVSLVPLDAVAASKLPPSAVALWPPGEEQADSRVDWVQSGRGLLAQLDLRGAADWTARGKVLVGRLVTLAADLKAAPPATPPAFEPRFGPYWYEGPGVTPLIVLAFIGGDILSGLQALGAMSDRVGDAPVLVGVFGLAAAAAVFALRAAHPSPAQAGRIGSVYLAAIVSYLVANAAIGSVQRALEEAPRTVQTQVVKSRSSGLGVLQVWMVQLEGVADLPVDRELGAKLAPGRPVTVKYAVSALGRTRALELTPQ